MTLTIFVSQVRPLGGLKHYFATGLSAAVLVVVALAGAGLGQASDPTESRTPLAAGRRPAARVQLPSLITYHLVESSEQVDALRHEWMLNSLPPDLGVILVVDTPEKEAEARRALTDALSAANVTASGVDGRIVDLRGQ